MIASDRAILSLGAGPCELGMAGPCGQVSRVSGAIAAATKATQATGLVEPLLLALRPEEPAVPQLPQDPGALHRGLKSPQQPLTVLAVTKYHEGQTNSPGPVWPDL